MGFPLFLGGVLLNTVVVIDYQNMHLTGLHRFERAENSSALSLHPLKFAEELLIRRNQRVKNLALLAELRRVEVFRGLPSHKFDPQDHARNLSEQYLWTADSRVEVTHRPLKYRIAEDSVRRTVKVEKGIDVLCALSVIRNVLDRQIDLIILASHDSDLEPAIEEGLKISQSTRIETVSWFNPKIKSGRSKMNPKLSFPIWNTQLEEESYVRSISEE